MEGRLFFFSEAFVRWVLALIWAESAILQFMRDRRPSSVSQASSRTRGIEGHEKRGPSSITIPMTLSRSPFSPRLAEGQKGLKVENKAFFSRLTFFNVSEQDYGNYTCVASNLLGNTNASMILYGE